MAFKLSELLNPAPSSRPSSPKPPAQPVASPPPSHKPLSPNSAIMLSASHTPSHDDAVPSRYEAAASLQALAMTPSGSSAHFSPYAYPHSHSPQMASNEQLPPIASLDYPPPSYNEPSRRLSGIAPVQPSPILEPLPTAPSPTTTLDQYHQKPSRSPDAHRQQSFSRFEAPVLAPIQQNVTSESLAFDRSTPQQGSNASDYQNSTILPPPSDFTNTTNAASMDTNYHLQGQVSDYSGGGSVSTHIREFSAVAPEAKMAAPAAPEAVMRQPVIQSPPHIKDEPSSTLHDTTEIPAIPAASIERHKSEAHEELDPETLKIIEAAKNEYGTRRKQQRSTDEITAPEITVIEPASKKRPAPKNTAANKRGTAKKPPPKRRKMETGAGQLTDRSGTPSSRHSFGPTKNSIRSTSNTPAIDSSPAPGSAAAGSSEVDGEESANEEYCICRKGDNHTWMIACDGGCEDWFHGKCVGIKEEDGDLIDKYICPNCETKDIGVTTWLPMCRRDACRQPARLKKSGASKYCSDECGRLFMQEHVNKSAGARGDASPASRARNRRKANRTDNYENSLALDGADDSDEDMGPRGGALRPAEIKALVISTPDIARFRLLGEGVLSPPTTASPPPADGTYLTNGNTVALNDVEAARVSAIANEKDILRMKRGLLKDKEKFVSMTRERVGKYAEREGLQPKEVCGYDRRLTWTEDQFHQWRKSKEGVTALEMNSLDPLENGDVDAIERKEGEGEDPSNGDKMDIDAAPEKPAISNSGDHFCSRKRCERHRQWQKQALADVRFEESTLADQMRRLEKEDREIREGATLRWRKEMGGDGARAEGWTIVV